MARYIVTGAAGFIGAKVSELLLRDGHEVVGIDNLDPAYDIRLKEYRLKSLENQGNFSISKSDIRDLGAMRQLFASSGIVDAVINLAAKAGVRDSVSDPWAYYQTNVDGTLNLLEMCRQHCIKKFILASTSSIYGNNAPYPTPESADSSHPLQPYAASKKAAETLCHSYHYLHGTDVTVVRFFTVYGPAGRPNMSMFRFTKWIEKGMPVQVFGNGQQTRGFTYVDDIARGTIQALKPLGYEIINLGGHETISINDLIKRFENLLGKRAVVEYKPAVLADMDASWADVNKARSILGWEPQVRLEDGLKALVDWYLKEYTWASQVSIE